MATSLYAALLGLMLIGLSLHVIRGRRTLGVGLGDADDLPMRRRIRAQANLAEYAPLFLLQLGFAEHNGLPVWAVHAFGLVFLAGRAMHAYSLLKAERYERQRLAANPAWRVRGMACTFTCMGLLAFILLAQPLQL